ncbi:LamG-like jellyroll fold domain-containing protein [Streptomyces sp. NPDC055025]
MTGTALTALLCVGGTTPSATAVDTPRSRGAGEQARTAAGTEQEALTAARESGDPAEVLSLRHERGETFANPDGTFTAREYAQPVRTRKGGTWADIDTTLAEQANGRLAPRATTTAMTFSGGGDKVFATLGRDGRTLSFFWPEVLPEPEVDGDSATYRSVLPDVDLVVRAENDGLSHLLVVKTAEAAANPALSSIELPVRADGLEVSTDTEGGIVAEDAASGGAVFEAPQPLMWDSRGALQEGAAKRVAAELRATAVAGPAEGAQVADVGLEWRQGSMVLTPDQELLTGQDTRYPVFIDPVSKTVGRTGWTWVSSANPTLEGWKFANSDGAGESGKGVGRCPADVSVRCASGSDVQRQYYAIPTGSLEGKTILKAEFAITLVHTYNSEARSVQLHRVNSSGGSAISSKTNWSNRPSSKAQAAAQSPTNPAGNCSTTNQNVRFQVTSTVQQAVSSGWETTTFGLQAAAEDSYASWKRFCNNAALEITYNRAPYQPKMSELTMNPGGKCAYGEAQKHYADEAPMLQAIVRDQDHGDVGGNTERLKAEFEIFWTGADGKEKRYSVTTGEKTSNSDQSAGGYETFKYRTGTDLTTDDTPAFTLPQNTVIGWRARGSDGTAWGPWSDAGTATRCEFIYDATKPDAPIVTSPEYPDDDLWHRGVGDYGSFTLYSPGTGIASYRYQFTGEAQKTALPVEPGRPVTVRWMPPSEGPYTLFVEAVDQAGNSREVTTGYTFRVEKGRAPKTAWSLADPAGSSQAADGSGGPAATAGPGVTFGMPGPHGSLRTAAQLDGSAGAYLDSGRHVVDTDKTFSVAAWVMLPELPRSSMTVVSQDGSAQSGFSLGYDGTSKRWSFLAPDSEIDSMTSWEVLGPQPVTGEWTHLIGVYDMNDGKAPGTMRMYINGRLISGDIQQRSTTWNATGGLQIGRALEPAGYTAYLKGIVADVQVFDRVVAQGESTSLGGLPPRQLGYWNMDEAVDGTTPDITGGTGLSLRGSASVYRPDDSCDPAGDPECLPAAEPLWGDGHLLLGGTDGYADRAAGLLKPKASFTVTARARLSSPTATIDQSVLSLVGSTGAAARVRYNAAADRWQLTLTEKDTADAVVTEAAATGWLPSAEDDGDHLALSYNALFAEVQLFVNGEPAGPAVSWPNTWDLSKAGIQVGRTSANAVGREYFSGAIDEVRVFEGALDQPLIAAVAGLQTGESLGSVT